VLADFKYFEKNNKDFTLLENNSVTVNGVVFWGATLWTDFNLYGDPIAAQASCKSMLNDTRRIADSANWLQWHKHSVASLEEFLLQRQVGEEVCIITHYLPSQKSISQQYAGSSLNSGFASNLDHLVTAVCQKTWLHGHTHSACDYYLGGSRVICNPRGYPRENKLYEPKIINFSKTSPFRTRMQARDC
jgi:hypothetical protein